MIPEHYLPSPSHLRKGKLACASTSLSLPNAAPGPVVCLGMSRLLLRMRALTFGLGTVV